MTYTIHQAVDHRDSRLENEETFSGRITQQKVPFELEGTHVSQRAEPCNRLYSTTILSSSRHEVYTHDPQLAFDSPDFLLESEYDQHGERLAGTARTCVQLETTSDDHRPT